MLFVLLGRLAFGVSPASVENPTQPLELRLTRTDSVVEFAIQGNGEVQGRILLEHTSDRREWYPLAVARAQQDPWVARWRVTPSAELSLFRARTLAADEPDPQVPSMVTSGENYSMIAAATAAAGITFRATITGTAIETWTEQFPEQRAVLSLNTGQTRSEALFTAVRDEMMELKLTSTVAGTRSRIGLWEVGPFGDRKLIADVSCEVPNWEWRCNSPVRSVSIRNFYRYEWDLSVQGQNPLGYGTAELWGVRLVQRSQRISCGSDFIDATITRAESPKDVGGFDLSCSPTRGGTISSREFQLASSHRDVTVRFSDTGTTSTGSDRAHVIATTTKGCGDCNRNGLDDCDEIRAGLVTDCDSNDVPDDCELGNLSILYVDSLNHGCQNGTESHPFRSVSAAYASATDGDTIRCRSGYYDERLILGRPLRLEAHGGRVTIGL